MPDPLIRARLPPETLGCRNDSCPMRLGCARWVASFFDSARPAWPYRPDGDSYCVAFISTAIPGPVHLETAPGVVACGLTTARLYTLRPELVTCEGCRRG